MPTYVVFKARRSALIALTTVGFKFPSKKLLKWAGFSQSLVTFLASPIFLMATPLPNIISSMSISKWDKQDVGRREEAYLFLWFSAQKRASSPAPKEGRPQPADIHTLGVGRLLWQRLVFQSRSWLKVDTRFGEFSSCSCLPLLSLPCLKCSRNLGATFWQFLSLDVSLASPFWGNFSRG